MFTPMAFTVCAAVLGSLVLALTYVPVMSSFLLAARSSNAVAMVRGGARAATRSARVGARRIASSVVGGAVACSRALASVPFLGTEFMPKLDEG